MALRRTERSLFCNTYVNGIVIVSATATSGAAATPTVAGSPSRTTLSRVIVTPAAPPGTLGSVSGSTTTICGHARVSPYQPYKH
jgi:hypothetical protein